MVVLTDGEMCGAAEASVTGGELLGSVGLAELGDAVIVVVAGAGRALEEIGIELGVNATEGAAVLV